MRALTASGSDYVSYFLAACLHLVMPVEWRPRRPSTSSSLWPAPGVVTIEGEGREAEAEAQKIDEVVHDFRVSAAGTVVMETMGPGTKHEMINMYHLDGDDLVLTHYCAGGNQPTMKLNRERSTVAKLVFDFTGGTNLDPAVDEHIHSAELKLTDPKHLESIWEATPPARRSPP